MLVRRALLQRKPFDGDQRKSDPLLGNCFLRRESVERVCEINLPIGIFSLRLGMPWAVMMTQHGFEEMKFSDGKSGYCSCHDDGYNAREAVRFGEDYRADRKRRSPRPHYANGCVLRESCS